MWRESSLVATYCVYTLDALGVKINWPIAHNNNHMCYIKTMAGKVHIITNKCVTDKHIHYIQFSVRGSLSQTYEKKLNRKMLLLISKSSIQLTLMPPYLWFFDIPMYFLL